MEIADVPKVGLNELLATCFAVIYEDDGPNGICGQSCSITNPWKQLYVFETEEKMREFSRRVENDRSRKNSRITYLFYPYSISPQNINFIAG
jgi:hypothetical protein